jgi:prevent-host-death family protein
MKTFPLSEVKIKLSRLIDELNATDEEIVITRNGTPAAVLVSAEEFDSWRETRTILSDAALMSEIRDGLKALKRKQAKLYTLEELFK